MEPKHDIDFNSYTNYFSRPDNTTLMDFRGVSSHSFEEAAQILECYQSLTAKFITSYVSFGVPPL